MELGKHQLGNHCKAEVDEGEVAVVENLRVPTSQSPTPRREYPEQDFDTRI